MSTIMMSLLFAMEYMQWVENWTFWVAWRARAVGLFRSREGWEWLELTRAFRRSLYLPRPPDGSMVESCAGGCGFESRWPILKIIAPLPPVCQRLSGRASVSCAGGRGFESRWATNNWPDFLREGPTSRENPSPGSSPPRESWPRPPWRTPEYSCTGGQRKYCRRPRRTSASRVWCFPETLGATLLESHHDIVNDRGVIEFQNWYLKKRIRINKMYRRSQLERMNRKEGLIPIAKELKGKNYGRLPKKPLIDEILKYEAGFRPIKKDTKKQLRQTAKILGANHRDDPTSCFR